MGSLWQPCEVDRTAFITDSSCSFTDKRAELTREGHRTAQAEPLRTQASRAGPSGLSKGLPSSHQLIVFAYYWDGNPIASQQSFVLSGQGRAKHRAPVLSTGTKSSELPAQTEVREIPEGSGTSWVPQHGRYDLTSLDFPHFCALVLVLFSSRFLVKASFEKLQPCLPGEKGRKEGGAGGE